jgi:hypothetical protein
MTLKMIAIVLIALGVVALAYQGITFTTRDRVVDVGPVHVTTEKTNRIPVPPILGAIALIGGIVLLLADRKRLGRAAVTLLVAGLFACAPQQPSSEVQADARATPGSNTPRASALARLTVPQGTEVPVTLSTAVGSKTSQVGDRLTATTTAPVMVGDRVAIPTGSTISGHVTGVSPATKGLDISEKGGAVALSFNKVTTPQGFSTSMSASLVRVAKSTGKTIGIIGGSAAGGAVIGRILGHTTKDTAIGAVLGGGIGTGIAAGTKGKELVIPAGTDLALTLDQALIIADRSGDLS